METTIGTIILLMIPILGLIFSIICFIVLNKRKDRKVIMNKIIKYRNKHPRCRYCKYNKFIEKKFLYDEEVHECIIKKTFFLNENFIYNLRGCFCDYFEPEALDEI